MKMLFYRSLVSLLLFSTLIPTAQAELVIRITDGSRDGIPIMIAPFPGGPAAAIIAADLQRSGRFTLIPPQRAGNQALQMGQSLNRTLLQNSGADYLVVGREPNHLEFEVINVATGQRTAGYRIPRHTNQRRMAHKAADLIFESLTGKKGAFDTRIAYVAVNGRNFELIVSDADGYNPQIVLRSNQPIISPSWSPNGTQLAYVSFETGRSAIYVQDLNTGSKRILSAQPGNNGAPAWSPDGRHVAMSISERGNSDIFIVNANGSGLRRLTSSRGIDTEPAWANTSTLIYTSDQGGSAQLYQTSTQRDNSKRITFNGRYNSAASVLGNTVAMVRGGGNRFRIAVMNAASREERFISPGGADDSPSLAPNGTMVLYATRSGGRDVLAVSSINGKARQILSSPVADIRDPAWSPYLR